MKNNRKQSRRAKHTEAESNFAHKTIAPEDDSRDLNALSELLTDYAKDRTPQINQPHESVLKRFSAIPLLHHIPKNLHHRTGSIDFDSWRQIPAVQLRDIAPGFIRRICLKAKSIKLEIVAERQQSDWEFTARVYDDGEISMEWVLAAGKTKMMPKSLGFYQWDSKSTPCRIRLLNQNEQINFEKIKWA